LLINKDFKLNTTQDSAHLRKLKNSIVLFSSLFIFACDHPAQNQTQKMESNNLTDITSQAIAHPDRPTLDLNRDPTRVPQKVLRYFDVRPGDKIAELLAADGYYTELFSRCVGDKGVVYMQNNQKFYDFQTDKSVIARLSENRLPNVLRWDKELTNLEFEENSLDKIFMILVLHDFYWMEKDVDRVIEQAFRSLKPGGVLGIIDHAAAAGTGNQHATDMQGIHRIDANFVKKTMLKNGFFFDGKSNVLSQANDDRSKAFFHPSLKGKPTDRFMMRFKKPEAP